MLITIIYVISYLIRHYSKCFTYNINSFIPQYSPMKQVLFLSPFENELRDRKVRKFSAKEEAGFKPRRSDS